MRGRPIEAGIAVAFFAPPLELLASGTAILWLWIFPVVECSGDACLIGQNPVGLWLIVAGFAVMPVSAYLVVRKHRGRSQI